jgi:hypothetical protein
MGWLGQARRDNPSILNYSTLYGRIELKFRVYEKQWLVSLAMTVTETHYS